MVKLNRSELEEVCGSNAKVRDLLSDQEETQHAAKNLVEVNESMMKLHRSTNGRAAMGRSPSKGPAQEGSPHMP